MISFISFKWYIQNLNLFLYCSNTISSYSIHPNTKTHANIMGKRKNMAPDRSGLHSSRLAAQLHNSSSTPAAESSPIQRERDPKHAQACHTYDPRKIFQIFCIFFFFNCLLKADWKPFCPSGPNTEHISPFCTLKFIRYSILQPTKPPCFTLIFLLTTGSKLGLQNTSLNNELLWHQSLHQASAYLAPRPSCCSVSQQKARNKVMAHPPTPTCPFSGSSRGQGWLCGQHGTSWGVNPATSLNSLQSWAWPHTVHGIMLYR